MKEEEKTAYKYLSNLNLGDLSFEPKGNRPPDFSIDDIGIEVRRLNLNYFDGNQPEGLEEFEVPFIKMINDLFNEFNSEISSTSYWVSVRYYRNKNLKIQQIKKLLRIELKKFIKISPELPYDFSITDDIELTIVDANIPLNKVFNLVVISDLNAIGFVVPFYVNNIKFAISEKTNKIQDFLREYNEWWLLLINRIPYSLQDSEKRAIIGEIKDLGLFTKLILINPLTLETLITIEK